MFDCTEEKTKLMSVKDFLDKSLSELRSDALEAQKILNSKNKDLLPAIEDRMAENYKSPLGNR